MSSTTISLQQLKEKGWVSIHGRVYDISAFDDHPGGKDLLLSFVGKDATMDFEDVGHSDAARKHAANFFVGFLEGAADDNKNLPTVAEIAKNSSSEQSSLGLNTGTIVLSGVVALVGACVAYFALSATKH